MIIPTGYAQVNLKFTGVAVPLGAEVTFGVQNVGARTADALADLIGDQYTANNCEGTMQTECSLTSILVKLGPNDTGASSELGYIVAGELSGAAYSPNCSMLMSKITGLGGRKGRGRMFLPGLSESFVSAGGVIDAGTVASAQLAWTNYRVDLEANDAPMVLLHTQAGLTPTPITSLNASNKVSTQRRRLRR